MKSLRDFTKSKYVVNGKLAEKYRTGKAIRANFYPTSFSSAAEAHRLAKRREFVKRKKDEATIWQPQSPTVFASPTSYVCPGNGTTKPHLTDWRTSTGLIAIDHRYEVSQQWNDTGHNAAQEPRATWYQTISNLDPMCTSCNGAKSGPDYVLDIGPNFRGDGDPA